MVFFKIMIKCKMFSKLNAGSDFPVFGIQRNFELLIHRVYQNSMAKLQEWTPHIETRNKVYDNMGPEMHNYRVI
jgi:hypothetical protein